MLLVCFLFPALCAGRVAWDPRRPDSHDASTDEWRSTHSHSPPVRPARNTGFERLGAPTQHYCNSDRLYCQRLDSRRLQTMVRPLRHPTIAIDSGSKTRRSQCRAVASRKAGGRPSPITSPPSAHRNITSPECVTSWNAVVNHVLIRTNTTQHQ